MSLAETTELLQKLSEVNQILDDIISKSREVERDAPRLKESGITAQQATRMLFRFNHILSHLGLPENVNAAIRKLQQLVFMARMVLMSMNFLAMGTGYGTFMGIAGFVSTGFSAVDWVQSAVGETQA